MTEEAAPRRRVRGKNRAALLDAVDKLMTERNTLDISITDISTASGVNPSLVKYYFGNKDGMLLALLLHIVHTRRDAISKEVHADISPREKIRRRIQGVIELLIKYPYLNGLTNKMYRDGTREHSDIVEREVIRPLRDSFASVIDEGVKTGDFNQIDGTVCFFLTIGACDYFFSHGYITRLFYNKSAVDPKLRKLLIDQITQVILGGIVRPAPLVDAAS